VDGNITISVESPHQSAGDGTVNDKDLNARRTGSETSQKSSSISENFITPSMSLRGRLSSPDLQDIARQESNSVINFREAGCINQYN
jgi:hypothetical protein